MELPRSPLARKAHRLLDVLARVVLALVVVLLLAFVALVVVFHNWPPMFIGLAG